MNRLQDCFDDDDAGDDVSAGMPHDPSAPLIEGIDYLYNPQAARDAGGPFTHDAYGEQQPEGEPAADAGESGEGFNQMFQGGRVDPDAGLMDFRHRDMHPCVQRWLGQEPLGYVDGPNVYNAPIDEPVNRVDPLGMDT